MKGIIKSLKNSKMKKEFISSSAYNSFLDPHYVKLLNRFSSNEGKPEGFPLNKKNFQFYSVNQPASLSLNNNNVNNDCQINRLIELEDQCADLLFHVKDAEGRNVESNNKPVTYVAEEQINKENIEQTLGRDNFKEYLKFLDESTNLSNKLKEQLIVIEEIGAFSNELLKQMFADPNSSQIELYNMLKDYSSSLAFDS
jgi:hypothetical protein